MNKNYYEILGIPEYSSEEEIKKKFRELVKKYHPDRGGDPEKFKEILEAYQSLSSKEKKLFYDSILRDARLYNFDFYKNNGVIRPKTLSILGIATYVLSNITSVENLKGILLMPLWFILLSQIFYIVFLVLAIKYTWKFKFKFESMLLLFSSILLFVFQFIQEVTLPPDGSLIIIFTNITKIVNFLAYFWIVVLLWKIDTYLSRFK
ncbi:MAG: hypothetical protein KatS3mg096_474 [Candidatus Parcubacteria bacterium]|nr:MAG: hypothetical protein KatS3mg096_474 [Candidatus Parcubacteria bacterium]